MKIERHGRYFRTDQRGFLVNDARLDAIPDELGGVVPAVVDAYLDRYGDAVHGVFLRGSVPQGLAVPGLSDLDTMAVMQPGRCPEDTDEAWEGETEARLLDAFPGLTGIELFAVPVELVRLHGHQLAFTLATQGLCVYGEDATRGLPGYRIGPELAYNARSLQRDLQSYLEQDPLDDELGKRQGLSWIAKRFLRVGMELSMLREQRFTRALYLCYESFARQHPERQADAWRALEMALSPEPSPARVEWVSRFGSWMVAECQARFASTSESPVTPPG